MNDIVVLAAGALVAGAIAGVVLHFNVASAKRAAVVKWSLTFGLASCSFVLGAAIVGANFTPGRGVLGLAFVGFPILVAGVTVLVLGRIASRRREREASDV